MRLPFQFAFIILLLCCNNTYSQQPFNFKFKTYTASNGLVHNFTKKCLKDSKGFLWIITQHGLSRFDGVNFKNFEHSNTDSTSLPENDLEDIAIDKNDNIWLAYNSGLCFYNQATHSFSIIKQNGKLLKSGSILFDKKRNCIWSVNMDGYSQIDGNSHAIRTIRFLIKEGNSTDINPMLLDSGDRLWIPYARSRYHCIHLKTGSQYFHAKRIEPTSFYEDEEKNIWLCTWQHGFRRIMVKDSTHEHILYGNPFLTVAADAYDFISQGAAQSSILTGDSILWVVQNTGGLLLFNKSSNTFIRHFVHDANDKNGIATDFNEGIYCDPSGIIWLCTWHGLTKVNRQEQQFLSKEIPWLNNTLYNCVAGLADDPYDKDITWMSVNGTGIIKYKKSTGEVLNKFFYYYSGNQFKGKDKNYDWRWTEDFIKDEHDNLWTYTYGGLVKISKGKILQIPIKDPDGNFTYPFAVKQFSKGTLWWAAAKGIARINTTDNSYIFFQDTTIKNDYDLGDLEQLNDSSLLISNSKGMKVFEIGKKRFSAFKSPFLTKDTANESASMSMEIINNKLYIATLAGLKVMDLATKKTRLIGKEQGIDKISYHRLHQDKNKNLWIYTAGGLYKYDPGKNSFEKFSTSDGIYDLSEDAVNIFNYNNQVYIGYRMAITYFDPMHVNVNSVPVNPVISEVLVTGKTIDQSLALFESNRLQLRYDQNEIVFIYTAPDFTNADKITFQYMLEGYDKNWINAGTGRKATYNNLPPGNYTFKLKAANSSGIWNEKATGFSFHIATPFWKSWWFKTLIFAAVIAAGYLIYRYRLKQIKHIYEVRSNISRSLHDDVGATLSSINIYSDVARTRTNDPAIKQLIDKVYHASANAMENMSDIVWYVNPKNDLFENLLIRMREYALPLLEAKGINVAFEAKENIEDLKTTMQQRHHLYLIFKEAVNNALKYSGARHITIQLSREGDRITMQIADDGKGFNAGNTYSGNGIKNMYFRAKAIEGELRVHSTEGKGSQVILHFPIT